MTMQGSGGEDDRDYVRFRSESWAPRELTDAERASIKEYEAKAAVWHAERMAYEKAHPWRVYWTKKRSDWRYKIRRKWARVKVVTLCIAVIASVSGGAYLVMAGIDWLARR